MFSLPFTVADSYRSVVRVDPRRDPQLRHRRRPNGALSDQATFPTTATGLRRAWDWIGRRTGGDLDAVLVAAQGTGSYGAVLGDVLTKAGYRVV